MYTDVCLFGIQMQYGISVLTQVVVKKHTVAQLLPENISAEDIVSTLATFPHTSSEHPSSLYLANHLTQQDFVAAVKSLLNAQKEGYHVSSTNAISR